MTLPKFSLGCQHEWKGHECAKCGLIESDTAQELQDLKDEIKELLDNAWQLVRGTREEQRAKGYWYAQIRCALDNDHDFLGGSMCTMADSITALRGDDEEEE